MAKPSHLGVEFHINMYIKNNAIGVFFERLHYGD